MRLSKKNKATRIYLISSIHTRWFYTRYPEGRDAQDKKSRFKIEKFFSTKQKIITKIKKHVSIIKNTEKYYALLIGNNDYKHWEKLDAAVNDVVAIGKILESKYGYDGSRLVDFSLTAFSKKIKLINGSIGGNIMFRNTSEAYWNGIEAPNSKSTIIIPGVGALWSLGFATLSVNVQKPIFIDGAFSGGDGNSNEKTDTWQISIGMRRILNYYIPWLYW